MRNHPHNLTGFAEWLKHTSVNVVNRERIEVSVPNRGTIQINHAIAYCWLRSLPISVAASIESTDNEVIVHIGLNQPPVSEYHQDQLERFLELLHFQATEWVHEEFARVLFENSYIFEARY